MSARSPQNQLIRRGPPGASGQRRADALQDVGGGGAPAGEFAAVDAEHARFGLTVGAEYGFSRSVEGRLGRGRQDAQTCESLRDVFAGQMPEGREIVARDGEQVFLFRRAAGGPRPVRRDRGFRWCRSRLRHAMASRRRRVRRWDFRRSRSRQSLRRAARCAYPAPDPRPESGWVAGPRAPTCGAQGPAAFTSTRAMHCTAEPS